MNIRIFGVQRSGTNYLETLIGQCTPLVVTAGNPQTNYWKHSFSPEAEFLFPNDIHIVVVKNPFKWLESLHRYNADLSIRSGEYDENIFNGEKTRENSKCIIYDKRQKPTALEGAIHLYNTFYNRWFDFSKDQKEIPTYVIRYEDIIRNKSAFLKSLQHRIGIKFPIKGGTLKNINQSSTFPQSRIKEYLNMRHFSVLEKESLEYAQSLIDTELVYKKLRYPKI